MHNHGRVRNHVNSMSIKETVWLALDARLIGLCLPGPNKHAPIVSMEPSMNE